MDLLAVSAALQAGAAATRETADALETAAGQVGSHADAAAAAAGHAHVRDGLDGFATFHTGVLRLLAVAADAVAGEIAAFDQCMTTTDRDLAAGC